MTRARHERLRREVARYRQIADTMGASEGDVPSRYAFGPTARYALRWGAVLVLGAPFAAFGALLWLIPYLLPRVVVRFAKPEYESVATYKLAGGFFAFPLTLAVYVYLAWHWAGAVAALATAVLAPLLGFIALGWSAAWKRFGEDVRLFTRVLFRREAAARLAEKRAELAREFDAIDGEIDRDLQPAEPGI